MATCRVHLGILLRGLRPPRECWTRYLTLAEGLSSFPVYRFALPGAEGGGGPDPGKQCRRTRGEWPGVLEEPPGRVSTVAGSRSNQCATSVVSLIFVARDNEPRGRCLRLPLRRARIQVTFTLFCAGRC